MPRVLIIEDDAVMRDGIAMVLEANAMDVRTAAHGADGLAVLAGRWRPDVILLDLMMPVMSGWQFREAQLADPATAGIPVVVLSGHNDLDGQSRALRPAGYLQKPFAVDLLLKAVAQACGAPAD